MLFMKTYKKYLIMAGLIWAACFVVFLMLYIFVLGPQKNTQKSIESRLAEKQQVYKSALRAAHKETQIRLNEQIESLQDRLKNFVVDFEDSANLTFEISQIANEKEVASFSIEGENNRGILGATDRKYISESQIVISFIGGFNQFATFLNALERHRPVLLVDKFTIARSGREGSGYQISLNVTSFVRKQQDNETADKKTAKVYGKKI